MKQAWIMAAAMLAAALPVAAAETQAPPAVADAPKVLAEKITVHSPSLHGNLEGNPAERDVIVYLPADYHADPQRRYPVVYALHGYSIDNDIWSSEIRTPQTVENAFASGTPGMIVVLPDSRTVHNGSMYSTSVTTGDFEGFIARDLVAHIDSRYRTLPQRESRGLAGHSMGGYGTTRIGMKYPDVFGALYIMSPCCLSARGAPPPEAAKKLEAITTPEEAAKLDFMGRATFAVAAAWSPNPEKPPLYLDLGTKDGVADPEVVARWAANAPLAMADQYMPNLRRYKAIAFDVGDRDGLKDDTVRLHEKLKANGIDNSLEIYPGDHVSGVAVQFQTKVLPFFAKHLVFGD